MDNDFWDPAANGATDAVKRVINFFDIHGSGTISNIAKSIGMNPSVTRKAVNSLRKKNLVFVCDWVKKDSIASAVYSKGNDKDVERPLIENMKREEPFKFDPSYAIKQRNELMTFIPKRTEEEMREVNNKFWEYLEKGMR